MMSPARRPARSAGEPSTTEIDEWCTGALIEHHTDADDPPLEHLLLDLVLVCGEIFGMAVVAEGIDDPPDGPFAESLAVDHIAVDELLLQHPDDLRDEGLVEHDIPARIRSHDDARMAQRDGESEAGQ